MKTKLLIPMLLMSFAASIGNVFGQQKQPAPDKTHDVMKVSSIGGKVTGISYSFNAHEKDALSGDDTMEYDVVQYSPLDKSLTLKQGVHNVNIDGLEFESRPDKIKTIDVNAAPESLKQALINFMLTGKKLASTAKPYAGNDVNITGGLTESFQTFSAASTFDRDAKKIKKIVIGTNL